MKNYLLTAVILACGALMGCTTSQPRGIAPAYNDLDPPAPEMHDAATSAATMLSPIVQPIRA